jgi:hypothetical protein
MENSFNPSNSEKLIYFSPKIISTKIQSYIHCEFGAIIQIAKYDHIQVVMNLDEDTEFIDLGDNYYTLVRRNQIQLIPHLDLELKEKFSSDLALAFYNEIMDSRNKKYQILLTDLDTCYHLLRWRDYRPFQIKDDEKNGIIRQTIQHLIPKLITRFNFDSNLQILQMDLKKLPYQNLFFQFLYLLKRYNPMNFERYKIKLQTLHIFNSKLRKRIKRISGLELKIQLNNEYKLIF